VLVFVFILFFLALVRTLVLVVPISSPVAATGVHHDLATTHFLICTREKYTRLMNAERFNSRDET
jgi:hypothetical protein